MGGYSNPFDTPLQSELQEHQQQQAATQQASPTNNPFEEPLASEKAEAQTSTAAVPYLQKVNTGPYAPAGQAEKAMGEATGDNAAQEKQALESLKGGTLATVGGVLGAGPLAGIEEGGAAVLGHIAREWGAPAVDAITQAAKSHPIVAEVIKDGLKTAGLAKALEYLGKYGKH